jgi:hypothetical protein
MYLDSIALLQAHVGYGELGTQGSLGYEGKGVRVQGRPYPHALSTHAPARLIYQLDGCFARFICQVAINDDVFAGATHADFSVLADGRQVVAAPYVVAGDPPCRLSADIFGAQRLELVVRTSRWDYCHAVWLDPQVDEEAADAPAGILPDCLGRTEITVPTPLPRAQRCIATIVSPGFTGMLDNMLGSLYGNGGCQDALLVVFAVTADEECQRVATKYGATLIHCQPKVQVNPTVKSVLYTIPRVVDADQFLCLDADMLVLGDLRSVFDTIEACPEGSILVCREANGHCPSTLGYAIADIYRGSSGDFARILGTSDGKQGYPLVVNDGLFAGSRSALLALDGLIRRWTHAPHWVDERRDVWWRNQFIFNLALAQLDCGVELDPVYNVQLQSQDVAMYHAQGRVGGIWRGRTARVLHFCGWGKNKYPAWRGLFTSVPDQLMEKRYQHRDEVPDDTDLWNTETVSDERPRMSQQPDCGGDTLYLDAVPILQQETGYGELGLHGALGYEDLRVSVQGKPYHHAISAHAPSCLVFDLDQRFASFRCRVALNDDVPAGASHANFTVVADGRVVAAMPYVAVGDPPRVLTVDISGVKQLVLTVSTTRWAYCHAVWLDPEVSRQAQHNSRRTLVDSLARVEMSLPDVPLRTDRCIATVVSPGYADLLDDLLGSLAANGCCHDALVVVFAVCADEACQRVIAKYGATTIPCTPLVPLNKAIKSVMYSVARVVEAWQFLCLDADTLILEDLRPIFVALDACPRGSILVCRDAYLSQGNLLRELCTYYAGQPEDLALLLGTPTGESAYPLVVNDGVFAGSRGALLVLDNLIRNMSQAVAWVDQYPDIGWRNQFIFNLALARMNCGIELDPTYNLQVHVRDVQMSRENGHIQAMWQGQSVRVLHFCGWGRDKYPEWRGFFAQAHDQLVSGGHKH